MTRIGHLIPRSTSLLTGDQLLSALRRTQLELDEQQASITTGKAVSKPSDSPSKTPSILALQQALEARAQHEQNLQHAVGVMNNVDASLSDSSDILLETVSIALSQIGIIANPQTRANQAVVIDEQLAALIGIANRQFEDVSLFGGSTSVGRAEPVFVPFLGGVRYTGSRTNLEADGGMNEPVAFNSNGDEVFGALSTRVVSNVDLDPQATATTRLDDVDGELGFGIRLGSIRVIVDGTTTTLDLLTAETLGDVVTRINNAITNVEPTAGSLALSGRGFTLTANAGHAIQIAEVGNGENVADLGIALPATGATVAGGDIDPKLTLLTPLSALGAPIDFTGGLKIDQGGITRVADFSSATTIQDLINVIDHLNLGLRMEINPQETGLNLVNEVSGVDLSVGENAGGSTAENLGVRTYGIGTQLSDFRFGIGVSSQLGEPDFAIRLHDGTTFQINIDGVGTVAELINQISTQATATGISVGNPGDRTTNFNVGLALDGNGLQLEDNTAGATDFRVEQLGLSLAATDLGINLNVQGGNVLIGGDNVKVRVESVFSHLQLLRDALKSNNEHGITFAGQNIELDLDKLVRSRADVGVRTSYVEQQQQRSATLGIAEQTVLSELQDANLAQVITRFTQLVQQLEASMTIGAQSLRTSLLDFLR